MFVSEQEATQLMRQQTSHEAISSLRIENYLLSVVNLCLTSHLKAPTAADHMKDLGRSKGMGAATAH